jgi:hypothetical protein
MEDEDEEEEEEEEHKNRHETSRHLQSSQSKDGQNRKPNPLVQLDTQKRHKRHQQRQDIRYDIDHRERQEKHVCLKTLSFGPRRWAEPGELDGVAHQDVGRQEDRELDDQQRDEGFAGQPHEPLRPAEPQKKKEGRYFDEHEQRRVAEPVHKVPEEALVPGVRGNVAVVDAPVAGADI